MKNQYKRFYSNRIKHRKFEKNSLDWLIHYAWKKTVEEIETLYYQYLESILGLTSNSGIYLEKNRSKKWKYDLTAEDAFLYEEDIRLALYKNIVGVASEWDLNWGGLNRIFVHGQHQNKVGGQTVFPDLMVWRFRGRKSKETDSEFFEKAAIEIKPEGYCLSDGWDWLKNDLSKLNSMVKGNVDSGYFICLSNSEGIREKAEQLVKKYKKKKNLQVFVHTRSRVDHGLPSNPYSLLKYTPKNRMQVLVLYVLREKIMKERRKVLPKNIVSIASSDAYDHFAYGCKEIHYFLVKHPLMRTIWITQKNGNYCICVETKNKITDEQKELLSEKSFKFVGYDSESENLLWNSDESTWDIILKKKKRLKSIDDCLAFADEAYKRLQKLMKTV